MDEDEGEEGFVDVWPDFFGLLVRHGCPGGVRDTVAYYGLQSLHRGPGVRLEEAGIDLPEDVSDGFCFVGEFYREGILELRC